MTSPRKPADAAGALRQALVAVVARRGSVSPPDPSSPLVGTLDSIDLQRLAVELSVILGTQVPLRLLFDARSQAELAAALAALPPSTPVATHLAPLPGESRRERTNLGFAQERLAFMQRLVGDGAAYHSVFGVRIEGRLGDDAVARGLRSATGGRGELRAAIVATAEGFRAVRVAQPAAAPDIVELESWDDAAALQRAAEFARQALDLGAGRTWHVQWIRSRTQHLLTFAFHHAVIDQQGFETLLGDFWRGVRNDDAGTEAVPGDRFGDFAAWHRHWFREHGFLHQRDFWLARLAGVSTTTFEPCRPRPPSPSYHGARHPLVIEEARWLALERVAAAEGATLAMLLHAALVQLLRNETGATDITLGVAVAARNHAGSLRCGGVLVNTLALRVALEGCDTVGDLLRATRQRFLEALEHQDMPFEVLVEQLKLPRRVGENPLFGVMLNVLNVPPERVDVPGLAVSRVEVDRGAAQFDLTVTVDRQHGRTIHLEYATDLYDPRRIACIAQRLDAMLEAFAAGSRLRLAELPHLGAAERLDIGRWSTGPALPASLPMVAHKLGEQAARDANRIAVRAGERALTYGQLADRVRQLAGALRREVPPGTRIGLMLGRDENLPAAILAALHAGVPFVPLDPRFPAGRLAFIAGDAEISLLLVDSTTGTVGHDWLPAGARIRHVQELVADSAARGPATEPCVDPAQAAYVLYTSGTTGQPKGVVVPQGALAAFLQAMSRRPGMDAGDRLLALTTVGFDISLLELLLPCWCGAEVVVASREDAFDAGTLGRLVARHSITVMQATPSTWLQLLESGWTGSARLRALVGGEPMPPELPTALGGRVAELWNLYGPTETTVWSTCHRVGDGDAGPYVPIGQPIDGTRVAIVDGSGRLAGTGVRGEIVIGGHGVADGYLGRPELTASRFVQLPGVAPGERFYRTGDVGRWRADGQLECLGRLDDQLKIRGHRIEPGEIESVAASVTGVRRAAAVALRRSASDVRLALFVSSDMEGGALVPELRAALRASLPDYMHPQQVHVLAQFPLLPNGKIDRAALAATELEATGDAGAEPPRPGLESSLAAIWRDLLGHDVQSRHDSFFDVGGHSLLAMRLVTRVREDLRRHCSPAQVFRSPTLAQLASVIDAAETLDDREVVTLRAGDDAAPLFCICGVNLYRKLAERLAGSYAVHAIYLGMDEEASSADFTRVVTRLAARYVEVVRSCRPSGPYRLAGFSFGGVLAHEMARQLEAAGMDVELVVMLDSDVPGSASESLGRKVLRGTIGLLRRPSATEASFHNRAIRGHPPVSCAAPALFVKATAATRYDPGYGWDRLCPNLAVVHVDCGHEALLAEPDVGATAAAIDAALALRANGAAAPRLKAAV